MASVRFSGAEHEQVRALADRLGIPPEDLVMASALLFAQRAGIQANGDRARPSCSPYWGPAPTEGGRNQAVNLAARPKQLEALEAAAGYFRFIDKSGSHPPAFEVFLREAVLRFLGELPDSGERVRTARERLRDHLAAVAAARPEPAARGRAPEPAPEREAATVSFSPEELQAMLAAKVPEKDRGGPARPAAQANGLSNQPARRTNARMQALEAPKPAERPSRNVQVQLDDEPEPPRPAPKPSRKVQVQLEEEPDEPAARDEDDDEEEDEEQDEAPAAAAKPALSPEEARKASLMKQAVIGLGAGGLASVALVIGLVSWHHKQVAVQPKAEVVKAEPQPQQPQPQPQAPKPPPQSAPVLPPPVADASPPEQYQVGDGKSDSENIDLLLKEKYGRPTVPAVLRPKFGAMDELENAQPPEHRYDEAIAAAVKDTTHIYPVPPELVKGVIRQESNFNPRAVSKTGAIGLMQLMPFNAKRVGLRVEDLWDPDQNILGGVRLLAVLLKYYRGDVISALIAYNAQPRKLFSPLPKNGETPDYVKGVLGYWQGYLGKPLRELNGSQQNSPTGVGATAQIH